MRSVGDGLLRLRGGAGGLDIKYLQNDRDEFLKANAHLKNVENAMQAVKRGLLTVGVKGKTMMAVGMERRQLQKLERPAGNCKLWQVDEHILGFSAGLVVDAKALMHKCMLEALTWRMEYEECPTVGHIARFLSAYTSDNALNNKGRPFGCSIILGGPRHSLHSPASTPAAPLRTRPPNRHPDAHRAAPTAYG